MPVLYLIFILTLIIKSYESAPIIMNCLGEKQILLTFDDGPDIATESILNVLDSYSVKGMFFINGLRMLKYNQEQVIKQMFMNGHQLASHTFSHPAMTTLNSFNIYRELFDNELEIFRKLFNIRPLFIRAPYFDYDERILTFYDTFGYIEVDATFESTDWYDPPSSERVINVIKGKIDEGGSFINLVHEQIMENIEVVEAIIPYALEKNYTFVTASECLGMSYTYQDDNTYGPFLENGVMGYLNQDVSQN